MGKSLVLVKPEVKYPVKKQGYSGDVGMPLGLLYLASFVRDRNDTDVSIKDYRLQSVLGLERKLDEDLANADVVGITVCTAEAPDALTIAKEAKKMDKVVIMGGLYPTLNAERMLRTGAVDYVVMGEGELGISNLLSALEGKKSLEGVQGIAYLDKGDIIRTPNKELITNLNELPMPAFDLVPVEEYAKFSPAGVYASRGCPLVCKFCTLNEFWEYKQRTRSFDNILQELEMLKGFG